LFGLVLGVFLFVQGLLSQVCVHRSLGFEVRVNYFSGFLNRPILLVMVESILDLSVRKWNIGCTENATIVLCCDEDIAILGVECLLLSHNG
jgi:hypothetical protein